MKFMLKVFLVQRKEKKIKLLLFESNQVGKYYLDGVLRSAGAEYQIHGCQDICRVMIFFSDFVCKVFDG